MIFNTTLWTLDEIKEILDVAKQSLMAGKSVVQYLVFTNR
jgi:hypothetical protein